jgi:hypothetical protein
MRRRGRSTAAAASGLVRLSAGTAGCRREAAALQSPCPPEIEWADLADSLRRRRLLALLGPRILELGAGDAGFLVRVRETLQEGRRQAALLELVGDRVGASLAAAGIRSAPIKGPRLSEELYDDAGRRLSSDVDVLVAPEQLGAAVEVVRGLGYLPPSDPVDAAGLPLLHFAMVHERGELPPVELHWRVHWYEERFASERLLPPTGIDRRGWRPDPADGLIALLLFYARDGFIDLRLPTDIGAWWDRHGSTLRPGALAEAGARYPELEAALETALAVAESVVGIPARAVLGRAPRLGPRQRLAARLAKPEPRISRAQLYAEKGMVEGLLAPAGHRAEFARRQLWAPPELREQQARHGARRRRRTPFGRSSGVIARYGLAVPRLLRSPQSPV